MKQIAYFIPKGEHDMNSILGDGWGPLVVYTDGTRHRMEIADSIALTRFNEEQEKMIESTKP